MKAAKNIVFYTRLDSNAGEMKKVLHCKNQLFPQGPFPIRMQRDTVINDLVRPVDQVNIITRLDEISARWNKAYFTHDILPQKAGIQSLQARSRSSGKAC